MSFWYVAAKVMVQTPVFFETLLESYYNPLSYDSKTSLRFLWLFGISTRALERPSFCKHCTDIGVPAVKGFSSFASASHLQASENVQTMHRSSEVSWR